MSTVATLAPWTIGVCAVGGIETARPSPGAVATLTVTTTRTWPDKHVDVLETTHEWTGYTAAELRKHWRKRAIEARWTHSWDGAALVVTRDRRHWLEVERFTFTDRLKEI